VKSYQIQLAKAAEKSLLKISQSLPAIGMKIQAQIEALKNDPHIGMKLQGSDRETRRIRVGDYRIIYEVYGNHLVILVVYIGPRGGAY
jgi:mRNA interferase RelE/StbE